MGLDDFEVICDATNNTQEIIDNRELRIDTLLIPEDSRYEMTFIVGKDGEITDFAIKQFAMFGGRWFRFELLED
jgi:hypothetical protein